MLTDVGDLPVQEIRDCGVDDTRLMNIVSESVKLVMEQVGYHFLKIFQLKNYCYYQIVTTVSLMVYVELFGALVK